MTQELETAAASPLVTFLRRQAEISAESFGADDPDVARFIAARMSLEALPDVCWHLNEALSMLHELHVEHHADGEGTPPGRGECEACDIWIGGRAALAVALVAQDAGAT